MDIEKQIETIENLIEIAKEMRDYDEQDATEIFEGEALIRHLKEKAKNSRLGGVSARVLRIESVGSLIKSMPLDQAIQIIKSDITGQSQTTTIDGRIVVAHVC